MSLAPGTRLGLYEILGAIGAGGMGEVYRARDSKLNREVAIKVLPDLFAGDPDRLARFSREAQTLAALNHPNIAHIHGLEESGGVRALVMELVEGEDLSERIARGAVPLDEALPIARQIVAALEAAHDAGIVHRDLKPANIKVRADGTVKVLDFGLAKAMDPAGTSGADLANSPTLTSPAMTGMGMILGTAAYMSPEQAKGRVVDRRADVWAFGVVLYEMLTGHRAFTGDDVSDLLVSVLRDTPNFDQLPAGTPTAVRRLLRRCLEKDPRKRLRDIGDAGVELDEATATPDRDDTGTSAGPVVAGPRRPSLALIGGVVALVAVASIATWWLKPDLVVDRPVTRFALTLAEGQVFANLNLPSIALSRDGRKVAYRVTGVGFIRDLDQPEARELFQSPGSGVWFSPDGESVLYTNLIGLARMPVKGGPAQQLTTSGSTGGADWTDDGTIVFAASTGLFRIPETGGTPQPVLENATKDEFASWPQVLPGGKFLLYTKMKGRSPSAVIRSIAGGAEEIVLPGFGAVRHVETGHLVYGIEQRLFAVPFDLSRRVVTGAPVPVLEPVATAVSSWTQAVFSRNGTIAFLPPSAAQTSLQLSWTDAGGAATTAVTVPRVYSDVRLSPDGRRVALHLWDEENDVWIADLVRGGMTRITFAPGEDETPVWSPDGRDVAYASEREGQPRTVFRKRADGSAASVEEKIWQSPDHFHVNDWSPDGRSILVEVRRANTLNDVIAIDVATGKETPLLTSRFSERSARLSRDGKWLAYVSDESGRPEVYVQPYPSLDSRVPVSTAGGSEPVWSHDGRRLFFRSADSLMAASVASASLIEFAAPKVLFADRYTRTQGLGHTHFDVAPDGRLLMSEAPRASGTTRERLRINVVLNWFEELKRLAPVK